MTLADLLAPKVLFAALVLLSWVCLFGYCELCEWVPTREAQSEPARVWGHVARSHP